MAKSGAFDIGVAQMGWEQRGNHSYYYRKERDGSRVKSVYVGRGEIARLDAAFTAMRQQDRTIAKANDRAKLATFNQLDADIDALSHLTSSVTQVALIAAGFHEHRRQWRKRRA